jgi:uncharacterized membrane protein
MTHSVELLWGAVLALHLLGIVAWVGGMAYSLLVLRPSLGLLDATPRMNVHLQTLRRFFRMVWHVMPIVLVTGWLMIVFREGGFAGAPWYVNTMQGLGVIMAAVFVYLFTGPWKRLRRAIRPTPAQLEAVRVPVLLNLLLGTATIVVASLGHFGG